MSSFKHYTKVLEGKNLTPIQAKNVMDFVSVFTRAWRFETKKNLLNVLVSVMFSYSSEKSCTSGNWK